MRKASFVLVGAIALCVVGYVGNWVAAEQKKPAIRTSEKPAINVDLERTTLKVGIVNLTRVIKQFNSANVTGDDILKAAKGYELELKAEKERLDAEQKRIEALPDGDEKDKANKALRQNRNALQEKDAEYQSVIRKRRDQMAVQVNKQIQDEIEKIAHRRGLQIVFTCPGMATKEEEGNLTDAMQRMTATAVRVGWCDPRLDITDELILALNRVYPPRQGQ
jgi:Skp family chaperone for outer membrane proteins